MKQSEPSTDYCEAHFDAKADRYQAALQSAPFARNMEVLPFALLLSEMMRENPQDGVLCDMLCGSGFLTNAFRNCFGSIHGIDVSRRMLRYYPVGPTIERHKAAADQQDRLLSQSVRPTAIVALAGLHHIYRSVAGSVDRTESDELQARLVATWANALSPGGLLIIADVTDPSATAQDSVHRYFEQDVASLEESRYAQLVQELEPSCPILKRLVDSQPANILELKTSLLGIVPSCLKGSPAIWFRETVERFGLFGHQDHFLRPKRLLASLAENKSGVTAYTQIPTPWLFSNLDQLIYFFYEKFALGPPIDSVAALRPTVKDLIVTKATDQLGLFDLPGGGVAAGWNLGYFIFKKCESPNA